VRSGQRASSSAAFACANTPLEPADRRTTSGTGICARPRSAWISATFTICCRGRRSERGRTRCGPPRIRCRFDAACGQLQEGKCENERAGRIPTPGTIATLARRRTGSSVRASTCASANCAGRSSEVGLPDSRIVGPVLVVQARRRRDYRFTRRSADTRTRLGSCVRIGGRRLLLACASTVVLWPNRPQDRPMPRLPGMRSMSRREAAALRGIVLGIGSGLPHRSHATARATQLTRRPRAAILEHVTTYNERNRGASGMKNWATALRTCRLAAILVAHSMLVQHGLGPPERQRPPTRPARNYEIRFRHVGTTVTATLVPERADPDHEHDK